MSNKTPLYDEHVKLNANIVDFHGWTLPIHYGSQIEEHHKVRQDAGMFDVSHMTVVDLLGTGVRDYLRHLLANDVDKIKAPGKALYSCMLNDQGGVIDDLIVYFIEPHHYRLVLNAATREKDLVWMNQHLDNFDLELHVRDEFAMVAVQGPHAVEKALPVFEPALKDAVSKLKSFDCVLQGDWFVARTGYTGEDGFEIILPKGKVAGTWQALLDQGVAPCGLGARDTLRLESGLNLCGSDMDESTTPLVANLGWTVAWEPADRAFVGRAALEAQKQAGLEQQFVGLMLEGRGILRSGQVAKFEGIGEGEITSGGFSPTLGSAIALARVPMGVGTKGVVDIRGKQLPVNVMKPCFVRRGKEVVKPLS